MKSFGKTVGVCSIYCSACLALVAAMASEACHRTTQRRPLEELNGLLLEAAKTDRVDGAKEMLNRGASPDAFELNTHDGDTALIIACRRDNVELARTLLDAGAHPNVRQHGNWSDFPPLTTCSAEGRTEILQLLLSHGARVNARIGVNGSGPTALFYACYNGQVGAAALLLANGAIVDRAAVLEAITGGHVEILERLLAAGGDPRWVLASGRTVLEEAERSPEEIRPMMIATVRGFMGT